MLDFLSGWISAISLVLCLFFLRSWRDSSDRLFLYFGLAFWLMAVERVVLCYAPRLVDTTWPIYLLRLAAFLVIVFAIVQKNLDDRQPRTG